MKDSYKNLISKYPLMDIQNYKDLPEGSQLKVEKILLDGKCLKLVGNDKYMFRVDANFLTIGIMSNDELTITINRDYKYLREDGPHQVKVLLDEILAKTNLTREITNYGVVNYQLILEGNDVITIALDKVKGTLFTERTVVINKRVSKFSLEFTPSSVKDAIETLKEFFPNIDFSNLVTLNRIAIPKPEAEVLVERIEKAVKNLTDKEFENIIMNNSELFQSLTKKQDPNLDNLRTAVKLIENIVTSRKENKIALKKLITTTYNRMMADINSGEVDPGEYPELLEFYRSFNS